MLAVGIAAGAGSASFTSSDSSSTLPSGKEHASSDSDLIKVFVHLVFDTPGFRLV